MAQFDDPTEPPSSEVKGIKGHLVKGVRFDDDQEIILLTFERLLHAG